MAKTKTVWDDRALKRAVSDAAEASVEAVTVQIAGTANSMGGSFRTGLYHRDHKSPAVGNTAPRYPANVERQHGVPIGIVYTGNYAAMVDNHLHNTLLKASG